MQLQENQRGHYHYLQGIAPYSSGVVAADGFEIICATLEQPLPWEPAMLQVRRYLESIGRDHFALCGVQLRCPQPHAMEGFIDFNSGYRQLLESWEMMVGEDNPLARTNVSPVVAAPWRNDAGRVLLRVSDRRAWPDLCGSRWRGTCG